MSELVTLEVASARIGVPVRALRSQIHRGHLPAARPPGTRAYLVDMADLRRLYTPVARTSPQRSSRETPTERAERQLAKAGLR